MSEISDVGMVPIEKDDVVRALDLFLEGNTVSQVLEIINSERDHNSSLSRTRLYREMSVLLKMWRESYMSDSNAVMARELARLEKLELAYWNAWENSQTTEEEYEEIQITGTGFGKYGDNNINQLHKRTRKRERSGNVDFLNGIQRTIEMRYRLLGISKTTTVNINWRAEAARAGFDPDSFVDAIVERIVDESESNQESQKMLGDGNESDSS